MKTFESIKESLSTIGIFFAVIVFIAIIFFGFFWWVIPAYYLLDKLIDKL